jgi:hypothetical protein
MTVKIRLSPVKTSKPSKDTPLLGARGRRVRYKPVKRWSLLSLVAELVNGATSISCSS